jgi:DNA sulfur modification protein DndB
MKTYKRGHRNYYPALRGNFGDWTYYTCLMSAKEIAKRIDFANEIHPSKGLSTLIQRELKKSRGSEIAEYLIREKQRFFNSMVAAVYEGDPEWHGFSNFTPQVADIDLKDIPEDAEDSVGFLSFSGEEKIFALDGQHRLAGIKSALTRAPSLELGDISLILVAHKSTVAGLERTRRLFTTLNKTARAVGKGEIIALDENDVMAIVARQLVDFNPHFSEQRIKFAQADSMAVNDTELTTIGNLYDVLAALFANLPKPRTNHDLRYIRPNDLELTAYRKTAEDFFDYLAASFPEMRSYFRANAVKAKAVVAKHRTPAGGHILFRPLGLRLFSELAAALVKTGSLLSDAVEVLALLPTELNHVPYKDVIWRNGKVVAGGRALVRDILLYQLGTKADSPALRSRYARTLGVEPSTLKMPRRLRG